MPDESTEDRTDDLVNEDLPGDEPVDEPGQFEEPETFPRDYVEQLRQENGKYRQWAQRADHYAQRLHTELVRATGRLADPTDLTFNEDHINDSEPCTRHLITYWHGSPT